MLQMRRKMVAALMLSCMFVNAGNYGLSLNLFAFGEPAMARAVVYYIISTMGLYSLGVLVASNGDIRIRHAIKTILKVPALYAIGLAGLVRWQECKWLKHLAHCNGVG
jgi:predicted permease